MNYQKIREFQIKMNDLNLRMQMLEELQKETLEKIKEAQENCNHDFILINRKYENKAYEYLQYGMCLVCGKSIIMTPSNVEINNKMIIDENQILDIAETIEEWNIDCDCSQDKIELEEAQRVFNSLTNDTDYLYSRDCIKEAIIEGVSNIKLRKVNR